MALTLVLYLMYLNMGIMGEGTLLEVGKTRDFIAHIGTSVTLQCLIKNDIVAKYYWYKQEVGDLPELVSSFYSYQESGTFSDKYKNSRFSLDAKKGRNHLKISDLQPSDTGTYYCANSFSENLEFEDGITIIVDGSGLSVPNFDPDQSEDAFTPNCIAHGRTIDEDHSIYRLRTSDKLDPGALYTWNNNTCLYSLSANSPAVHCAVATCGHLLSKKLPVEKEEDDNDNHVLVFILMGCLAFTTVLAGLLIVLLCKIRKSQGTQQRGGSNLGLPADHSRNEEIRESEDVLHYAAIRKTASSRTKSQKNQTYNECVYTGIKNYH